jgi:hypothetical protein
VRDLFESVILEPWAFVASVPELLAKGRAKIESQTKTANMIGKFVVPMAKRKIDAELKTMAESVRSYLTSTKTKRGPSQPTSPDGTQPRQKPPTTQSFDASAQDPKKPDLKKSDPKTAASRSGVLAKNLPKVSKPTAAKPGLNKSAPTGPTKSIVTNSTTPAAAAKRVSPESTPKSPSKGAKLIIAEPGKAGKSSAALKPTGAKRSAGPEKLSQASAAPTVNDLGLDNYDDLPASSVVGLLEALTPNQLRAISAYESSHRNRQTIVGGVARLLDSAQ